MHKADVNQYLREAAGLEATAKTFRTWGATVAAAARLSGVPAPISKRDEQRTVRDVVTDVSRLLGNTPTVCRASYIHPVVLEAYTAGSLPDLWRDGPARPAARLGVEERRTLHVISAVPGMEVPTRGTRSGGPSSGEHSRA